MSPSPGGASRPARILLADDYARGRADTRQFLETQPDFEIVGEAADGAEALRLARELRPDLLLLDVSMPRLSGVEVARILRGTLPEVRIVVYSGHTSAAFAQEFARLGVYGLVDKSAPLAVLLEAIRTALAGQRFYESEGAPVVLDPQTGEVVEIAPTADEVAVLRLVAQGLRNQEIAVRLALSERVVVYRLNALFDKLQADSRRDLVRLAQERGWLP